LVADCHSILATWRKKFSQLLNIKGVNDVRQTEIRTAVPLVPNPSAFEFEMPIEKLKRHKSPGIDHTPAKLINADGRKIALRSMNLRILFEIRKNCLGRRSRSL
jgi:hypothetical protein